MAVYIVADVTVQDASKYEEYKNRVPASLALYGGHFLVRGGKSEVKSQGRWIIEAPMHSMVSEPGRFPGW